mgnify:CR=1 FL=1
MLMALKVILGLIGALLLFLGGFPVFYLLFGVRIPLLFLYIDFQFLLACSIRSLCV